VWHLDPNRSVPSEFHGKRIHPGSNVSKESQAPSHRKEHHATDLLDNIAEESTDSGTPGTGRKCLVSILEFGVETRLRLVVVLLLLQLCIDRFVVLTCFLVIRSVGLLLNVIVCEVHRGLQLGSRSNDIGL
jgi:hypothetical protein